LTAFLTTFPKKDITRLIYLALEDFYCQHPASLDEATFKALAKFYEPDDKKDLLNCELALIYRWGHRENYQLVHQACRFLHADNNDKLSKTVRQIAAEAQAESGLNPLKGKRFFGLIAAVKRLWYCGIWGVRTPTFYVRRCNDKENLAEANAINAPERVRTSALPGKIVEQQMAYLEKTKRLQAMVNRIC
jgi:hypothetical protein